MSAIGYATSYSFKRKIKRSPVKLFINFTDTQFVFKFKAPSTSTLIFNYNNGNRFEVAGNDSTLVTHTSTLVGAGTYSFWITGDVTDLTYIDVSGQAFVSGDVSGWFTDLSLDVMDCYGTSVTGWFNAKYGVVYHSFTNKPSLVIAIRQNTMFIGWVDDGVFAKIDHLLLLGASTNDNSEAMINCINPGTIDGTLVGAPGFVALEGFTGASGKYINTNFVPSVNGSNYVLNSACLGIYIRTNVNETACDIGGGISQTSASANLWTRFSNLAYFGMNTGTLTSGANTDSRGLFVLVRDASDNADLYKNKIKIITGSAASTTLPTHAFYVLAHNSNESPAFGSTKQASLAFAGSELTQADITSLTEHFEIYMQSNGKGVIPYNLVCDGNSLTVGTASNPDGWSYPQLITMLNSQYMTVNKGVNSQTTVNMAADATTDIDTLINSNLTNVLVAWEVTNDIYFGATNETAYNNFKTYCQARQAAGWTVIALSTIPRGQIKEDGTPIEDYNADLAAVNTMMSTNWEDFCDAYVDLAADARLDDYSDGTYYAVDGIHLITAGYQAVAELINTAILAL